uniref:Uncharacterized protein n=1 Tax=Chlamydomonas leiostraca TaxID=1034604 RepID=A0A7S0RY07_9CHLO|mmetsp:Transcript_34649/g.87696  ORF Transcript_34649/g.87696 Transcript_34649/m.87696 type:complete len:154 (+) Transcript_34649:54-515(+)|eukprot:CAMPEP_0202857358 /NCGR_PEP_ID=MMETSP1391-20130828/333_1 /ASSEMBLY_ACC=CAM_ASM_000867 /TAXON_ID=1034604 /ORGANISM="Chlamydomonas leiostraca, Strain SAG 11-49" /LENGTH=153 /DNA_ID=CAMNT_0049536149 /DNA_START=54 /DNA_END=515 /DNA_ORIENTATION=-
MYDFCFTPPYAAILLLASLFAYFVEGSLISLVAGGGSAGLLLGLTYISFSWHVHSNVKCTAAVVGQLVISLALTGMMAKKFIPAPEEKIPQGVVGFCSLCMSLYYVWNLLKIDGPQHKPSPPPKKKAAGAPAGKEAAAAAAGSEAAANADKTD